MRDNVFGNLQKFNKAIRKVEVSNPSGVTEQQKINMAVAIHLGKTNKMDYEFKDFDPFFWRLYKSWLNVKFLPTFSTDKDATKEVDEEVENISPLSSSSVHSVYSARGKGRDATKRKNAKEETTTR